jgi:hypothetical protein
VIPGFTVGVPITVFAESVAEARIPVPLATDIVLPMIVTVLVEVPAVNPVSETAIV